jgi:ethanolaminephosphotransferase
MLTAPSGILPLLRNLLTLFLVTQSRVTNIPLFLLFEVILGLLMHLNLSGDAVTLTSILLQYTSFFALGGSNSISSIDLSNAYNGIDGYGVAAVGVLTFASNWAGPLWWMFGTNLLFIGRQRYAPESGIDRHLWLTTALNAGGALAVMLGCTILRAHLFIWTVFSPKYLYCLAWSAGQHFCVNLILGSFIFWVGSL